MPIYIVEIKNQHAVRDQVDLIMADQSFVPKVGLDQDDFNHLTYEGSSSLLAESFAAAIKAQVQESLGHDVEVVVRGANQTS